MKKSKGRKPASNKRLIAILACVVFGMFGFGYAMVPLYNLFCEITGIGGTPAVAATSSAPQSLDVDEARSVTVEFTATAAEDMDWQIKPVVRKVHVKPGEILEVNYLVKNSSNRDMEGQAIPSVTPMEVARHFVKLECFCFTPQKMAAGEERAMPVRFYVDPKASRDVKTITLSYSFYEIKPAGAATG